MDRRGGGERPEWRCKGRAGSVGSTVELVLGNGHHTNGNGHHDEALEPQQSLFSWADFLAEVP